MLPPDIGLDSSKCGRRLNAHGVITAMSDSVDKSSRFFVCIGQLAFYPEHKGNLFQILKDAHAKDTRVLCVVEVPPTPEDEFPKHKVLCFFSNPTNEIVALASDKEVTPGTFSGLKPDYTDSEFV